MTAANKTGRKPSRRPGMPPVQIRMRPELRAGLEKAAAELDITISEYMRRAAAMTAGLPAELARHRRGRPPNNPRTGRGLPGGRIPGAGGRAIA